MSTPISGGSVSGVGQPGFVARYGLAGPERQYTVDEVTGRIRELGLRTVRLAVVDQHGIPRGVEPPPAAEADPYTLDAPPLPASLADAVNALDADPFYRKTFGDTLISYLVTMKRFEIGRYTGALAEAPVPDGQDVSDWEMREYFEFF